MKTEMQELIEAAEQYRNWHEDLPVIGYFNEIRNRLITAISAARKAAEGGWIELKNNTAITDEMELGRYMGTKWVISRMESEGEGWMFLRPNDYYTHYRFLNPPLPSPPLSVETPKEGNDREHVGT